MRSLIEALAVWVGLAATAIGQHQSAVNTEFYQNECTLLIVGRYGYNRSAADHVTCDRISAIDLPGLFDWIKAPAGTEKSLAQERDRHLALTQPQTSIFRVIHENPIAALKHESGQEKSLLGKTSCESFPIWWIQGKRLSRVRLFRDCDSKHQYIQTNTR